MPKQRWRPFFLKAACLLDLIWTNIPASEKYFFSCQKETFDDGKNVSLLVSREASLISPTQENENK